MREQGTLRRVTQKEAEQLARLLDYAVRKLPRSIWVQSAHVLLARLDYEEIR